MKRDYSPLKHPRTQAELDRISASITPENFFEMQKAYWIAYLTGSLMDFQETYCFTCIDTGCLNPDHELMNLDRDIIPILKILHRKGYKTNNSCAGHLDSPIDKYNMVIGFAEQYDLPDIEEPMEVQKKEYKGRMYVTGIGMKRHKGWHRDREDIGRDRAIIESNRAKMKAWAEALPPAEDIRVDMGPDDG